MLLCYIYFADIYVHVLMYCFQRTLLKIGIIQNKLLSLNKDLYLLFIYLTKIKPECSEILYDLTYFPGPLVCRIGQVP